MLPVKIIAITNQKGGVGKTTTTANLGAAVAGMGRSLCLVDLDPQCHLTLHFGLDGDSDQPNVYDVLVGDASIDEVVRPVGERLRLAPASIDLAAIEGQLANEPGREQVFRAALAEAHLPDEFLMIDCPPSLGLLTVNALAAVDEVIIPLQPHFLALQGLGRLLQTISLVRQRINPSLRVGGVVLCMFERITRLANEVVADLQSFFADAHDGPTPWAQARIFETVVRRNIKLAECPSHGQSIFAYDPACHGAEDYRALAEEFLEIYSPGQDEAPAAEAPHAETPAVPAPPQIPPAQPGGLADAPQQPTAPTSRPDDSPADERSAPS